MPTIRAAIEPSVGFVTGGVGGGGSEQRKEAAMSHTSRRYSELLGLLLRARVQGDAEREDAILDAMDAAWAELGPLDRQSMNELSRRIVHLSVERMGP